MIHAFNEQGLDALDRAAMVRDRRVPVRIKSPGLDRIATAESLRRRAVAT